MSWLITKIIKMKLYIHRDFHSNLYHVSDRCTGHFAQLVYLLEGRL